MKQDIDAETSSLEKIFKKQDERVIGLEQNFSNQRAVLGQLENDFGQ